MERIEVIFNSINQRPIKQVINNQNVPKELRDKDSALFEVASPAVEGPADVKRAHIEEAQIKWGSVLNKISSSIDSQLYKAWLAPLRPISVEKTKQSIIFNLEANNKFTKEHILREYKGLITSAICEIFSCENAEINFSVNNTSKNNNGEVAKIIELASAKPLRKKTNNESNVNQNYNFSNFVVGSCNKLAHAACTKVSEELGSAYNPLFIYGDVGLGKTHLVNAIGNASLRRNKKVLLASSEKFVSELVGSLKTNSMDKFKSRFRNIDLLIIDDIQFIIGKQRTQEEFFHTFNELFNNQKQIVITADRLPQHLTDLEDRLKTRFSCGLTVDLQAPDLETRLQILNKKSLILGISIPPECSRLICERISSNVRELEGVLNRIKAYSSLTNSRIDLPLTLSILDKINPSSTKEITSDLIQEAVSSRFGLSISDLTGKRRTQNVALARQLSMYLCREITSMSYPEIGAFFGGRDHSTVIHAYKTIIEKASKNETFKAQISEIRSFITGR